MGFVVDNPETRTLKEFRIRGFQGDYKVRSIILYLEWGEVIDNKWIVYDVTEFKAKKDDFDYVTSILDDYPTLHQWVADKLGVSGHYE